MDQGESVCPACGLVQGTLQESHDKGISLSIGIRVYVSPMQDKISRLNKEATQLRADGNINAAIDNLKQVQVLMLDEPHYGIESLTVKNFTCSLITLSASPISAENSLLFKYIKSS